MTPSARLLRVFVREIYQHTATSIFSVHLLCICSFSPSSLPVIFFFSAKKSNQFSPPYFLHHTLCCPFVSHCYRPCTRLRFKSVSVSALNKYRWFYFSLFLFSVIMLSSSLFTVRFPPNVFVTQSLQLTQLTPFKHGSLSKLYTFLKHSFILGTFASVIFPFPHSEFTAFG